MDRIVLIEYLVKKYRYTKYLEIGTQRGFSFFPLKCKFKVAVDPRFLFGIKEKFFWFFKNRSNIWNRYFEMTSNSFFKQKKAFLERNGVFHIIFIDGLHTFEASLNDALNSIRYLDRNGIIILHDCFPPHKAASLYASNADEATSNFAHLRGWTGEWCGDTWKTIAYLKRAYPKALEVSVLNFDYGIGTIKIKDYHNFDFGINKDLYNQINKISYNQLVKSPEELINLKEGQCYKYL